jgi:thiol-disulfide isomerase/thioredoxin
MSLSVFAAALVLQVSAAPVVETPAPAKVVLETAQAQAMQEKKNVYVMFTASWCGWCKKHYAFMEANKEFYDKNFVTVHIDVQEQPEQKNLENAGGMEYMTKWKGAEAGLPFLVIINPKGELLGSSLFPSKVKGPDGKEMETMANTGHPWSDDEIAVYVKLLEKTVTHSSKSDIANLKSNMMAQEGRKAGG